MRKRIAIIAIILDGIIRLPQEEGLDVM